MLSTASHYYRTPLNAIIGFHELLKGNNLKKREKEKYIEIINKNIPIFITNYLLLIELFENILYEKGIQKDNVHKFIKSITSINEF